MKMKKINEEWNNNNRKYENQYKKLKIMKNNNNK